MFVGIDVATERLHCVSLDADGRLARSGLFAAGELDQLVDWVGDAEAIAIDAPAQLSEAPHRNDDDLARKFRPGRCAEIALGREHRVWVPWVTPVEAPSTGWMATGFLVYKALAQLGIPLLEVYPYGGYRALAHGAQLPKKQTSAGIRKRVELLTAASVHPAPHLEMWSHDGLDALLGALVSLQHTRGRARAVGCGHDSSAIWLPTPESILTDVSRPLSTRQICLG